MATLAKIQEVLKKYKGGTFTTIVSQRKAKTYKKCTADILKETVYKGARLGIGYDNMKQTQRGRNEGRLPSENMGLPWGEWHQYPYLITHKGNWYLRIYADVDKIKTYWFQDNERVSKDEIWDVLLASEKKNRSFDDKFLTLTINIKSIIL